MLSGGVFTLCQNKQVQQQQQYQQISGRYTVFFFTFSLADLSCAVCVLPRECDRANLSSTVYVGFYGLTRACLSLE